MTPIPAEDIVDLAKFVLTSPGEVGSPLVFNGKHYLQTRGTAIGTKMAPSYANIFMDKLEREILDGSPAKPYVWWRYIDDIFDMDRGRGMASDFLGIYEHCSPDHKVYF